MRSVLGRCVVSLMVAWLFVTGSATAGTDARYGTVKTARNGLQTVYGLVSPLDQEGKHFYLRNQDGLIEVKLAEGATVGLLFREKRNHELLEQRKVTIAETGQAFALPQSLYVKVPSPNWKTAQSVLRSGTFRDGFLYATELPDHLPTEQEPWLSGRLFALEEGHITPTKVVKIKGRTFKGSTSGYNYAEQLAGLFDHTAIKPFVNQASLYGTLQGDVFFADIVLLRPIPDQTASDDPALPRYLFIGDSISGNYGKALRDALKGRYNIHHPPTNCGPSGKGRDLLQAWLGDYTRKGRHWDVISFNFGHWDSGNTKEQYQENLESIVQQLKPTGAKLIWVTTCPVPDGYEKAGELEPGNKAPGRKAGVMEKYLNPWALEVMARHPEISICDQWQYVADHRDTLFKEFWPKNDVHFRGERADALGVFLAAHVENVMRCRPNVLLITADDMNYDSLGCTGNPLPGITPNLDRLAAEGVLFTRCYNTSTICGPSRASLLSGLYPQCNGNLGHGQQPPGFWKKSHPGFEPPSLTTLLRDAGYFTALLDKSATRNCKWDYTRNHRQTHAGRDPKMFYRYTKEAIETARAAGKPFFINANPTDPHRYWAGHPYETDRWVEEQMQKERFSPYPNGKPYPDPDRTYAAETVPMPPCFPDDRALRESIKHYYGSVNRLDMNVGAILKALNESGAAEDTMVVFLSDHGMGWAFAKWSLYPYGTRTPCIVRDPKKLKAGCVDDEHVLSTVDIAPTILERAGLKPHPAMNGSSFWTLATGRDASWQRQEAFSSFDFMNLVSANHEVANTWTPDLADRFEQYRPMRSVTDRRYVYVWNAWAHGKNVLPRTMGNGDEVIHFLDSHKERKGYQDRSRFYKYRVAEELYDIEKDPGCLRNLIHDPVHAETAKRFRRGMQAHLTATCDAELRNYAGRTAE